MKTINRIFMLAAMIVATACAPEDELTDITGRYGKGTEVSDTEIIIGKTANGYSFRCSYEIYPISRTDNYYEWNGSFKNIPSDVVTDSQGNKIGSISITSDHVTFTATTIRPGTYRAYRDEMADLPRSH